MASTRACLRACPPPSHPIISPSKARSRRRQSTIQLDDLLELKVFRSEKKVIKDRPEKLASTIQLVSRITSAKVIDDVDIQRSPWQVDTSSISDIGSVTQNDRVRTSRQKSFLDYDASTQLSRITQSIEDLESLIPRNSAGSFEFDATTGNYINTITNEIKSSSPSSISPCPKRSCIDISESLSALERTSDQSDSQVYTLSGWNRNFGSQEITYSLEEVEIASISQTHFTADNRTCSVVLIGLEEDLMLPFRYISPICSVFQDKLMAVALCEELHAITKQYRRSHRIVLVNEEGPQNLQSIGEEGVLEEGPPRRHHSVVNDFYHRPSSSFDAYDSMVWDQQDLSKGQSPMNRKESTSDKKKS